MRKLINKFSKLQFCKTNKIPYNVYYYYQLGGNFNGPTLEALQRLRLRDATLLKLQLDRNLQIATTVGDTTQNVLNNLIQGYNTFLLERDKKKLQERTAKITTDIMNQGDMAALDIALSVATLLPTLLNIPLLNNLHI